MLEMCVLLLHTCSINTGRSWTCVVEGWDTDDVGSLGSSSLMFFLPVQINIIVCLLKLFHQIFTSLIIYFCFISVCMFRHFKKLSFLIKVTMYIILSYLSSLQILFYYHWVSLDCWDVCLNYSYSVVHFSLIIFLFHFLSDSAIVS